MKKILIAVSLLTLGACGGNEIDDAIGKLKGFKAKVCACKTKECAEGVKKEMDAYGESMGKKMKDKKPSESQMKSLMELSKGMEECAKKFEEEAAPPAP